MIVAEGMTKRYGKTVAVDDLSFTVESGLVTGFLGPNGAGGVSVNGREYGRLRFPLHEVGALLEAKAIHPGRLILDEPVLVTHPERQIPTGDRRPVRCASCPRRRSRLCGGDRGPRRRIGHDAAADSRRHRRARRPLIL